MSPWGSLLEFGGRAKFQRRTGLFSRLTLFGATLWQGLLGSRGPRSRVQTDGRGKGHHGLHPVWRMLWLPADNHHKGTEGTGGNTGAKHSDKAKQTGPGYHFWQAIKAHHPPRQRVFRKPLLVGSWSHSYNTVPLSPFARTHPGPPNMEGWSGVPQERLQTEGRVGTGTEGQSWEARGSRTEARDDGTHTRSFYRCFHFRGKKPGSQGR